MIELMRELINEVLTGRIAKGIIYATPGVLKATVFVASRS